MAVRCLEDLTELQDARVLLRIDLERFGAVSAPIDDPRLVGVFTTVDWLAERGARVTLCADLGGASGATVAQFAGSLEAVLARSVEALPGCAGDDVGSRVAGQSPERVLLLGDLANEAGESTGNPEFAARLAAPFSHFVNDAFAASHLEVASVMAVAGRFPDGRRAIGRAMQTEVDALACLMSRPDRPNVAVLGGGGSARRFRAARALVARADRFGAVGGIGLALLAARGHAGAAADAHPDGVQSGLELLEMAAELQVDVVLPSDVRVGRSRRVLPIDRLTARSRPVDVGPETLAAVRTLFHGAETAFWCGETATVDGAGGSRGGDKAMARALGSVPGFSVTAGLETIDRVGGLARMQRVSHVVCGGEAALAFIAGERLPGLAAMED